MKIFLLLSFFFSINFFLAQEYILSFNNLKPEKKFDNINVKKISSDINSTTFAIWIKKTVRAHKHENHIENVYVTEGYGDFLLGDSIYKIKKGDLIVVPKNTWHGVKVNSKKTMKVISIQSPEFIGNDRVFKEKEN